MELPIIEVSKIKQINPIRKAIYLRHNNNLNSLILPNNSISSTLNEQKIKNGNITQDYEKLQKKIINIFNKKCKTIEKNKVKKIIVNNIFSEINNNKNISSNKTNIFENQNDSKEYKNKKEYIRNPFNSIKIRNEISSYIYSSPENQIRFINYIMNNKSDNSKSNENNKSIQTLTQDQLLFNNNNNIKNIKATKIKLIKGENKKDVDEDKINVKENSLLSLLLGNNKKKKEIIISRSKNIKNYYDSWDNNILKTILPQNIKYFSKNTNNKFISHRNRGYKAVNSMNYTKNKTRYDYEDKYKKINSLLVNRNKKNNKLELKSFKKLARSSSFC